MSILRIVLSVALVALIGFLARSVWEAGYAAAELACVKQTVTEQREQKDDDTRREQREQKAETAVASRTAAREQINREQTREVIRYVQVATHADCSLDADGLRLWRSANAGTVPDSPAAHAPGASAGAVPDSAPGPPLGAAAGPARESRGVGAALSPVSGAAQRPGALAGAKLG